MTLAKLKVIQIVEFSRSNFESVKIMSHIMYNFIQLNTVFKLMNT